jgi:hypothetical protein
MKEKTTGHRSSYLDATWSIMKNVEYEAYAELLKAIETDEQLRDLMIPKIEKFDDQWTELILIIQPEWKEKLEQFRLSNDLFRVVYDGMRLHDSTWSNKKRTENIKFLLFNTMEEIWEGKIEARRKK